MRYQVFYNPITAPEWVIVDTTRRNIWGNYWLEATFESKEAADMQADAWNRVGDRRGALRLS